MGLQLLIIGLLPHTDLCTCAFTKSLETAVSSPSCFLPETFHRPTEWWVKHPGPSVQRQSCSTKPSFTLTIDVVRSVCLYEGWEFQGSKFKGDWKRKYLWGQGQSKGTGRMKFAKSWNHFIVFIAMMVVQHVFIPLEVCQQQFLWVSWVKKARSRGHPSP